MKEKGTTLIEVVVSAAILVIVVLAAASYVGSTFKVQKFARVQTIRDVIARKVKVALVSPQSMFTSTLPSGVGQACPNCTPALRDCVFGTGACVDTGVGIPFNLFHPFEDVIDDITGALPIYQVSGAPPAIPGSAAALRFRWSIEGVPNCGGDNYQCPFVVETVFRPLNVVTGRPRAIVSKFRIIDARSEDPINDPIRQLLMRGRLFGPEPPWIRSDLTDVTWQTGQWESGFVIDTRKILQYEASACGPNQVVVGYDRFGQPLCRCFQQNDSNDITDCSPTCITEASAFAPTVQGLGYSDIPQFSEDGGSRNPSRVLCFTTQKSTRCDITGLASDQAGCKRNQWLHKVEFGKCRTNAPGKNLPVEVSCDQNRGTCCQAAGP